MLAVALAMVLQVEPLAGPVDVAPSSPNMVIRPVWIRRPSAFDFARLYPRDAMSAEAQGQTATSCSVTDEGALISCITLSEQPVGLGFAKASLSLMKKFKMKSVDLEGQPVAGRSVRIPIRWNLIRN